MVDTSRASCFINGYPRYKGHIEAYVVTESVKNYWRVADYMDYEDLISEGRLLFYELVRKRRQGCTASEFMAYFKTCWRNRIHYWSSIATRARQCDELLDSAKYWEGVEYNAGEFLVLVSQAPSRVRKVMNVITSLNVPRQQHLILRLRRDGFRYNLGLNRFLCELIGEDYTRHNVVKEFISYFSKGGVE